MGSGLGLVQAPPSRFPSGERGSVARKQCREHGVSWTPDLLWGHGLPKHRARFNPLES